MRGFLIYSIMFLFASCSIENTSNQTIPSYSQTLLSEELSFVTKSNILALSDDQFLTALEDENTNIHLHKITQEFSNDNWGLTSESLLDVGQGELKFFDSIENEYLIGFSSDNGFTVQLIDKDFRLSLTNNDLESFIDTAYNNIDSLHLLNFSYVNENQEILLAGQLFSQETSYSCVISLDRSLNPIWIKTYFENSMISNVLSINQDSFLLLNTNGEGTDLIRDNRSGIAYTKYNLTSDSLFLGSQSFIVDDKLYLTGVHNDIGRTIEVDLLNKTAFINDIDLYPVTELRAVFLSRSNFILAGIQPLGISNTQFSSELGTQGTIWCHRYVDVEFVKILDIIEMPGKGVLISAMIKNGGKYLLHLTRIDEEGATFVNQYTENCI